MRTTSLIARPTTARRTPALIALALTGVLLAGCSSSGDGGVASLDNRGTTPAANTQGTSADPAGDFASCLRDNGVPDAEVDGDFISIGADSSMTTEMDENGVATRSVNGQDITEAWDTCTEQVPEYADLERTAADGNTAEAQEGSMTWVQCAREAGFTTFTDPEDGVIMIPEGLTGDRARAVVQACPLVDIGGIAISGEPADGVVDAFSSTSEAS